MRRARRTPRWLRVKRARDVERRALTYAERERARRSGTVLLWIVVLAFAAAVLGWTCYASGAHAAARVPLTWTAPAGARTYEAIGRRPDGVELALAVSAESSSVVPLTPARAGEPDTGWVLVSTDWRAGAWTVRLRACIEVGCSGWSNRVVLLAGGPDTIWMLERPPGPGIHAPLGGKSARRAVGRVGWGLAPADSVTPAEIRHQEDVQRRERARLCELFGRWALRGAYQACP